MVQGAREVLTRGVQIAAWCDHFEDDDLRCMACARRLAKQLVASAVISQALACSLWLRASVKPVMARLPATIFS